MFGNQVKLNEKQQQQSTYLGQSEKRSAKQKRNNQLWSDLLSDLNSFRECRPADLALQQRF